ncbi:MAG: hypothetical protein QNJ31_01785 [Candidatus Caenarcaniphilales bacterium]|nr:hypothetical protein [Candidatus Caenarcaniphilales bacterium]
MNTISQASSVSPSTWTIWKAVNIEAGRPHQRVEHLRSSKQEKLTQSPVSRESYISTLKQMNKAAALNSSISSYCG